MRQVPENFLFFETYQTASLIEAAATSPSSFVELNWDDESVSIALARFSKLSLLHHFIYNLLAIEKRKEYRDNDYERSLEDIDYFKHIFKEYEIKLRDEKDFSLHRDIHDEFDHFYLWFLYQEDSFYRLWNKITYEVFHLLFANRGFLLDFNKSLSTYLRDKPNLIPHKYRTNSGKVKRDKYFPVWVKKAIFYRDKAKCVFCFKDLSGLLCTDSIIHFDHIVPLNSWGVNDPCNLQLLCEECNLKKGGDKALTSSRYIEWW